MKTIFFQMGFKNVEIREDAIEIQGYASTPSLDSYNTIVPVDVVENGLTSYRKNPIILLQHESDKPIGQAVSRDIESKGRNITAKITKNTDGIMDDIRSGTVKAFSIGFIPQGREYIDTRTNTLIKDMTEQDRDEIPYNKIGRVFTEIEIKEVSVVSVPANADSLFTMKRSFRQFFDEYETRSAVRYLVKDHENPFLDKVESVDDIDTEDEEVETAETVEDTPEMAGNEEEKSTEEETIEQVEEDTTPTQETTPQDSQEDGNVGETPTVATADDQSDKSEDSDIEEIEEIRSKLAKEETINDELIGMIEKLTAKVSTLETRLSKVPVNKPQLYQRDAKIDQLTASMIKAKGM